MDYINILFFVWLILLPPTLYAVVLEKITKRSVSFSHYYFPFALLLINLFSLIYFQSTSHKKDEFIYIVVENVMSYVNYIVILFVFPVVTIYYSFLSFKLFKSKISFSVDYFKNTLFWFVIAYIIFVLLWIINFYIDDYFVKWGLKTLIVLYFPISYYLLFHYQALDFDQSESNSLFERINFILLEKLEKENFFLQKDLSLRKAAKQLGTNEKYLSNTINKIYNQSFSNFINSYRVEYAKKILLDKNYCNYTIESIGNISGFNSKTNFNSTFKNRVGMTPSEYKQKKNQ